MISVAQCLDNIVAKMTEAKLHFGHGTDNAWDEAVQIVLYALDLAIDTDISLLERKLKQDEIDAIDQIVQQRIQTRKPLPYITQRAWFMGMPFYVDERVLVPRSPFAEWIACQFQPWVDPEQVRNILEIGTGSGCMAIAAALQLPNANVVAADVSAEALEVAQLNVICYDLLQRVQLIQSDCFENVPQKQYDIIMTNPPYVDETELASLPAEYQHEPRLALYADDDGLDFAERICRQATNYLTPSGILVIELGNNAERFIARYPSVAFVQLEQEHGGHGLLLLTKDVLDEWQ